MNGSLEVSGDVRNTWRGIGGENPQNNVIVQSQMWENRPFFGEERTTAYIPGTEQFLEHIFLSRSPPRAKPPLKTGHTK